MERKTRTRGISYSMTERIQKDLIVSNEVHSSLFLIKGRLQQQQGKNITLNEVVKVLISYYCDNKIGMPMYRLEEKE